jgi:hypothetical protein
MKLKELLGQIIPVYGMSSGPGLTGEELNNLVPLFQGIEEFEGKNVEVVENVGDLVTVIGTDSLQENIKLQSVFLLNGDVHIRCTKYSLK